MIHGVWLVMEDFVEQDFFGKRLMDAVRRLR